MAWNAVNYKRAHKSVSGRNLSIGRRKERVAVMNKLTKII